MEFTNNLMLLIKVSFPYISYRLQSYTIYINKIIAYTLKMIKLENVRIHIRLKNVSTEKLDYENISFLFLTQFNYSDFKIF